MCCDRKHPCIAWSGVSKRIPVLLFCAEAIVSKDVAIRSVGGTDSEKSCVFDTEEFIKRQIKLILHKYTTEKSNQ